MFIMCPFPLFGHLLNLRWIIRFDLIPEERPDDRLVGLPGQPAFLYELNPPVKVPFIAKRQFPGRCGVFFLPINQHAQHHFVAFWIDFDFPE